MNIPVLEANYAKLYTMTELRLCIETRCIAWSCMTNHLYGSLRWCIRKALTVLGTRITLIKMTVHSLLFLVSIM